MAIKYKPVPQPLKAKPISFVPDQLQEQLGKGLALPLTAQNNIWQTMGGVQKIRQNMYLAIMTPVGRHLMQPDFGSMLPMMIFEYYDATLQRQMVRTIKDSLKTWVPQITVTQITFDDTLIAQNLVTINVFFKLSDVDAELVLKVGYATSDSTELPPSLFMIHDHSVFGV